MTNPANVKIIVEKMIGFLRTVRDQVLRGERLSLSFSLQCSRVSHIWRHSFSTDNVWFIDTMTGVYKLGGASVKPANVQNLLRIVAEGSGDESTDQRFRSHAVDSFYRMVEQTGLNDAVIQVVAWVCCRHPLHSIRSHVVFC